MNRLDEPTTADGHVSIVRADRSQLDPNFLALVLSEAQSELEALQSGSTNQTELSPAALGSLTIPVPSPQEQRRVVAVASGVDAQIGALAAERDALDRVYSNALSLLWLTSEGKDAANRSLNDLMHLDLDRVRVDLGAEYPIAGVMNAGKGLISRGPMSGAATGYETLNRLAAGQVVMRKLTAWEGPIGVVPETFDGFFASSEFPTFTLDGVLLGRYFDHVCRSRRLWDEMKSRVTGTVQRRKRLNPEQLLGVSLPIPPLEAQERVAATLDCLRATTAQLTTEVNALRATRSDLLTAVLSQDVTLDRAIDVRIKAT